MLVHHSWTTNLRVVGILYAGNGTDCFCLCLRLSGPYLRPFEIGALPLTVRVRGRAGTRAGRSASRSCVSNVLPRLRAACRPEACERLAFRDGRLTTIGTCKITCRAPRETGSILRCRMSVLSAGKATTWLLWWRLTHRPPTGGLPPRSRAAIAPTGRHTLHHHRRQRAAAVRPHKARRLIRCLPHHSMIAWTNVTVRRNPDIDRFTASDVVRTGGVRGFAARRPPTLDARAARATADQDVGRIR